ncbi:MAG TPA: secretin N-terminal domain-containing protein, partial [Pyrinomonadaceae bacterium]|nr:secretin N-terminal domain-containing protein [Pyrinomonadaceae bacterium]
MTYRTRARSLAALVMAAIVLAAPLTALAKKGEKNYKLGLQYEQAQQWEKAAQEFALAVAARPSDVEYQLHYRRAIFNASQLFMQKGRTLADQGDYVGAYNAFRTAYGYDNVNELAANEMQRMLRLQREKEGLNLDGSVKNGARVSPTSYRREPNGTGPAPDAPITRVEQFKNVNYSGDLEPFIRQLAEELDINVIFDQNFSQVKRNINVKLKNVTAARTLDYIFQAYGLFFQRLDRRTILVADQSKRPVYQQLVLRTFYLNNIPTNEARQMIQAALPANAGRQPQVVENKTTNSITVRDTPENMRIIADLIKGIDKDRAEVVMEVSIYEVTRTDLLQVGNQFGTADTLSNLGGLQTGSILFEGARRLSTATAGVTVPVSTGVGLLIPSSALSLLQTKG